MAENQGRVIKSAKNMASGVIFRIISVLTAFAVRTVFIHCLSNDYLSVNGLYSSILSMLSLAELGFSTAMIYSMYAPLAKKDYKKLAQLIDLYKRVYRIIGLVILGIGLCIVPFLDLLIKDAPDIPGLTFYYLLFLANSVVSYLFFAYRNSILQADQRAAVVSNYSTVFNLIKSGMQIVLLFAFHNFTIYLLTGIACTILQNVALAVRVGKDYPIFGREERERLPVPERKKIFKDVKALMLQKISFKVLNTTDSLIISAFIGVSWVGLLSNYLLIMDAVVAVLSQITSAITASIGNFFAQEDREAGFRLFRRIEFMNYWLYGFCGVALALLLNPFIEIWIGTDYLLSRTVVIALAIRFFVEGFMNMMSTFRSTMGLFTQGQFLPPIVAALNIAVSIALSYPFGVAGVIIGTPVARCCINVWYNPWLIHKKGFGKPVGPFFRRYILRIALLIGSAVLLYAIFDLWLFAAGVGVLRFILALILTLIVPNLILWLVYRRSDEFLYLKDVAMSLLAKVKKSRRG